MRLTSPDKINSPKLYKITISTSHPVDATSQDLNSQIFIWHGSTSETKSESPNATELEGFVKTAQVEKRVSGER